MLKSRVLPQERGVLMDQSTFAELQAVLAKLQKEKEEIVAKLQEEKEENAKLQKENSCLKAKASSVAVALCLFFLTKAQDGPPACYQVPPAIKSISKCTVLPSMGLQEKTPPYNWVLDAMRCVKAAGSDTTTNWQVLKDVMESRTVSTFEDHFTSLISGALASMFGGFLWTHQMRDIAECKSDIAVLSWPKNEVICPLADLEFDMGNKKRKGKELAAHITNLYNAAGGKGKIPVFLGGTVTLNTSCRVGCRVGEVEMYCWWMQKQRDDAREIQLACAKIYSGQGFDALKIAIMTIVHFFNDGPRNIPPPEYNAGSNILFYIHQEDTLVRKTYRQGTTRRPDQNLDWLPGSKVDVFEESGVTVLEYPKIPGNHIATRGKALAAVVRQLLKVHQRTIVHADVHRYNVVFNGDNGGDGVMKRHCWQGT
jgi:hypothetical protein